ncbi:MULTISPECIES: hypothetical protein [unclassified Rhizobium]|uniref:hypothetical protein n=1 Tax=unclassified Rhizobium TaxID=2613769 RepID=UPI0038255327
MSKRSSTRSASMENSRLSQDHRFSFRIIPTRSSDRLPDALQELRISEASAALANAAVNCTSITRSRKAAGSPFRNPLEVIAQRNVKKLLMSLITARHACTTAKPCRPDKGRIACWIGLLPASAAYGGDGHQLEAVVNRQQPGSDVTGLGICKPAS